MIKVIVVLMALSGIAYGYTPPPGIPNPSDSFGSLDPIEDVAPDTATKCPNWPSAESIGCYYIDNTDPNATDTSNDYGYPDKPRMTIPEKDNTGPYSAGSYIELHGGPYDWAQGDNKFKTVFSCTEANPCWFRGTSPTNKVNITSDTEALLEWMIGGSYVFFENIKIGNGTTQKLTVDIGDDDAYIGSANHIVWRHFETEGNQIDQGNGASFSTSGISDTDETEYIVFYDGNIHDWGDDNATAENDFHGILPAKWSEHIWVLSTEIHNMGGDSMQIGSNNYDGDERTQYVYVGDCTFHGDYENAVDIKQAMDVILSSNEFYDYDTAASSDGTIVVSHRQNETGELDGPERIWVLFNKIHDGKRGVRIQETIDAWIIGNLIYSITCSGTDCDGDYDSAWNTGSAIQIRSTTSSGGIIDNTFYNYFSGIQSPTAPTTGWTITGNILTGRYQNDTYEINMDTVDGQDSTLENNQFYNSSNIRIWWGATSYTTLASFQSATSKCLSCQEGDPKLVNPSTDMGLQSDSPCIGENEKASIYDTFYSTYGVSIQKDYAGCSRPQDTSWDIGAYEYVSQSGPKRSSMSGNFTVH